MKIHLLIDYLSPNNDFGITEELDKIIYNTNQVKVLKENIEKHKNNKISISFITVLGRWIVFYHSDQVNVKNTTMYFFDYRIDTEILKKSTIFNDNIIEGIEQTQMNYYKVFNEKLNTFDLSFAEINEKIIKTNLFVCDIDNMVLDKAKKLGALPMIEKLSKEDKLKVVLVDEKIKPDENIITNIYALIHFGGEDSGFVYIKLFDLKNNLDKIDDFQKAIEGTGGKFDRSFFMEKFTKDKLN